MATRVLITGSSGFLGSELRRSLRPENFASLKEVNFLSRGGPSRVLEQAKEKNCSVVLQLAWDSNKNLAYDKSSVNSECMESTLELARLCAEKGVIFAGLGTCLDEELNLENEYISAKRNLKNELRSQIVGKNILWIRPHFVFSLEEKRPRLIKLIHDAREQPVGLHNGNSKNDYVHIADVGRALDLILTNECMGEVDIGSGFLTTNYRFATRIATLMDRPMPIKKSDSTNIGPVADISTLLQLGWSPTRTIEILDPNND